jgi:hypothetical protein
MLVVVNYAANQSQCHVLLPWSDLAGGRWRLRDQLSQTVYDRDGNDLQSHGLYLDEPGWKTYVFSLKRTA